MRVNYIRNYFTAVVILSIASLLPMDRAWSADGSLKAELQSRYAAMKSAMAAHNGDAIAAILAPDFVSVDISGQSESASQMIAEVNALKPDPNKSSVTTLVSISREANGAVVKQRYDMKTVRIATDGADAIELVTLSTDTWVKPTGTWLLERTVTNEMSLYRDGQLAMHKQSS